MSDSSQSEIFLVDDDPQVREALSLVLSMAGYQVTSFAEGASFLAAARTRTPSCILLDVKMPGRSGLDVLRELNAQDYPAPIFIISGHGDIPMAVEAIKNGAHDFIEKPFRGDAVIASVRDAIAAAERRKQGEEDDGILARKFTGSDLLTPREREVLLHIVSGASNKEAGRQLGISPRTIEVHRARTMEKLGAKNAADLVRIVMGEGRVH